MIKQVISERPVMPLLPVVIPNEEKKIVFVVGGDYTVKEMFNNHGWVATSELDKADLYVFTGGADVTPELYGQKNVASGTNSRRDAIEVEIWDKLKEIKAPMAGICRGGQFLNIMNGGTMWQDVDGHTGNHDMYILEDHDDEGTVLDESKKIRVSSTHHQMMRPDIDAEILAVAQRSSYKTDDVGTLRSGDGKFDPVDIEVLFYPETQSLCFQPHPEYKWSPRECTDYFFKLLEDKLHL